MTGNDEPPDDGASAVDSVTADELRDTDTSGSTDRLPRVHDSSRRAFLSDSVKVGGGVLALSAAGSGVAAAQNGGQEGEDDGQANQSEGFSVEVIAPHATFGDQVGAAFGVTFENGAEESAFLHDASTLVVARVTLEPGGTTGWHTHPGPVVVSVVEGELDITFSNDCVAHTYAAGEAFVDLGNHAERADNPSDTERAMVYAIFFGVPDGEQPTTWVEPPDC